MSGKLLNTSWDKIGWLELPNGSRLTRMSMGEPGDDNAPVIVMAEFPPNCQVAAHTHNTDYVEILLEGTQKVGAKWHKAGDIRSAKAGTGYGPLLSGPEGCRALVVFRTGNWPAVMIDRAGDTGLNIDMLLNKFT